MSELVFRLRNGREIGGCCAITFDDGWLDNYLYAYPILKEFQVPATIFLASSLIGSNKLFWPEELSYYLKQSDFRIKAGNGKIVIRLLKQLPEPKTEDQFLDQSIMQVKKWPLSERQELLDCLRVVFQRSTDHHRMLINWKEAQTMLKSGMVDFGAHTANHVILDQVSAGVAQQEIQKSRDEIGHHLGIDVELFSYPNGNFSPDLKQMVRKNRFKGAVTTQAAWVSKDTDLFAIPRIGIHEDVSFSKQRFFSRLILKRF
ncbi:MAG: polysaccharide deacetylase family protein [Proteobacteria bacterium]|nr:polysaccharide deacetylase family protein [Pseudomonadota bacterium]